MVIRTYVRCTVCDQAHTLRIGLGHNEVQEHTFPCRHCGEMLTVRMHLDFKEITSKLECVTSCVESNEEGLVVNLHPELLIPAGEQHEDFSFPWLGEMTRIFQDTVEKNPKLLDKRYLDTVNATGRSSRAGQISQEWNAIKAAWGLRNRGKGHLAQRELEKHYASRSSRSLNSFEDWFTDFTRNVVGGIADKQFEQLGTALRQSSRTKADYVSYCSFVREEHKKNQSSYFQLFQEFFKDYSEYSQVLLYIFSGLEIPEDLHASSHAFNNTRMFYGNAFEVLTNHLVVLATLSNVLKGRPHDQFERLPSLKAYRELKKESKCGPFADVPELNWICADLDTSLRNASHHAAIRYNETDATITYQSGGTGAERTMSYASYLYRCFDIFRRLVVLLRFEMTVAQIADQQERR